MSLYIPSTFAAKTELKICRNVAKKNLAGSFHCTPLKLASSTRICVLLKFKPVI